DAGVRESGEPAHTIVCEDRQRGGGDEAYNDCFGARAMSALAKKSSMATSAQILDALQSLFEAEQASIFRFMRHGTPYLTEANMETRRLVEEMADASVQHATELAE